MKRLAIGLAVLTGLGLVALFTRSARMVDMVRGGSAEASEGGAPQTRLTANGTGIADRLPPADFTKNPRFGPLRSLPKYNPDDLNPFQVDLRSRDITNLDLTSEPAGLRHALWDSKTKWPRELPPGFDPAQIMEVNKNPGLGVRALHAQGLTGKGVSVGLVDQGLLADHEEYRDRIRLYEEIDCVDRTSSMHGPGTASLLVGKTIGVAPEADLYYIATTFAARTAPGAAVKLDLTSMAKAIDRLLEVNRRLPKDKKIRVISISARWRPQDKGSEEAMAAVGRAKREGVFVISNSMYDTHSFAYGGLARDLSADPDRISSYSEISPGSYEDHHPGEPWLFAPMDARTVASPTGTSDYMFGAHGGFSWTIPYFAGLYAIACQVKPDLTPQKFWSAALRTGDTIEITGRSDGKRHRIGPIVNPARLIESVRK